MICTDIFAYNFEALEHSSIYELQVGKNVAGTGDQVEGEEASLAGRRVKHAVVLLIIIGALCLYCIPSIREAVLLDCHCRRFFRADAHLPLC